MHDINLLPWRNWARQQSVRRWQVACFAAVMLGALVLWAGTALLKHRLAEQVRENLRLEERLAGLGGPLAEAEALRARHERLVEQRNELDRLQARRLSAADLLDGLARAVPEQVRLDSVQLSEAELSVSGVARSGGEVAQLLWALGRSPGMGPAELRDVAGSAQGERFQIRVVLHSVESRGPA